MKGFFCRIAILTLLILNVSVVIAQQTKPDDKYNRQEVMIQMRDGVKLHTVIFTPKDQKEKLPILMLRTPYGGNEHPSPEKKGYIKDMAEEVYIFCFQEKQGRYLSEGTF